MINPAASPVILVHGLWMHGLVMRPLARRLAREGFATHCFSYPTLRRTLSENADTLARFCRERGLRDIHIVAHSMGGLVALRMLERHADIACRRLVLLGTPYRDSHAARRLARWPGGTRLLGHSIGEWLATPRPQPRAGCDIALIAGTRSLGLAALVARDLPPPHDGVVSVGETRVPGALELDRLPVTHSGMLLSGAVAARCAAFLRSGRTA
jgi:pimeloyl-ACP methyl ester carboxylesterase